MKLLLAKIFYVLGFVFFRWAMALEGPPKPRPVLLLAAGPTPSKRFRRLVRDGEWN